MGFDPCREARSFYTAIYWVEVELNLGQKPLTNGWPKVPVGYLSDSNILISKEGHTV